MLRECVVKSKLTSLLRELILETFVFLQLSYCSEFHIWQVLWTKIRHFENSVLKITYEQKDYKPVLFRVQGCQMWILTMEWMFPLWDRFWGQYSLLLQFKILEKLVTYIPGYTRQIIRSSGFLFIRPSGNNICSCFFYSIIPFQSNGPVSFPTCKKIMYFKIQFGKWRLDSNIESKSLN